MVKVLALIKMGYTLGAQCKIQPSNHLTAKNSRINLSDEDQEQY
jgi:hypothetical protein